MSIIERFSKEIDLHKLKRDVDPTKNYSFFADLSSGLVTSDEPSRGCPICSTLSEKREVFVSVYEVEYVSCPMCGHIFQDRLPELGLVEKILELSSNHTGQTLYRDLEKQKYRLNAVVEPKLDFCLDVIAPRQSLTWLDIGCGSGELLKVVSNRGHKGIGIEKDADLAEFGHGTNGVEIRHEPVEMIPDEYFHEFDVISLFLILEHLVDPKALIKKITSKAKNDQWIVMEVNNAHSFSSALQKAAPERVDRHLLPCAHLNMFTPNSLNTLFKAEGYTTRAIWWFGQDAYQMLDSFGLDKSLWGQSCGQVQFAIDRQRFCDRMLWVLKRGIDKFTG